MDNRGAKAILTLFVLLSAGCLETVEEIIEDVEQTIDAIGGDYPRLEIPERTRSTPSLHSYGACDILLDDLQQSVYDEMVVSLDQESYWHWVSEPWMTGMWRGEAVDFDGAVPEAEMATDDSSGASAAGTDSREGEFSGTNNQEAGVDEADFLKTDGYHIYMLNGQLLLIMGVPEFGNLTLESNLTIEGNPSQMMIEGDDA